MFNISIVKQITQTVIVKQLSNWEDQSILKKFILNIYMLHFNQRMVFDFTNHHC